MDTRIKTEKRARRHKRIRSVVYGTAKKPRLSVFRSNRYITLQLIDDERGVTLASANTKDFKGKTLSERAYEAGKVISEKAKELKVDNIVFDRGGYLYTGSVAEVARGAREGGLKF